MKLFKHLSTFLLAISIFLLLPIFHNQAHASWSVVSSPNINTSFLNGVKHLPSGKLWSVGQSTDSNFSNGRTLTERYANGSWGVVASPGPASYMDNLTGVSSAPSAEDAWVSGYTQEFIQGTGVVSKGLVLHWNDLDLPRSAAAG